MNYAATYCALISKRLQNPLSKKDCYCETHHIIPKSEGGDDSKDNLVNLTAREHYVAHLLLARIYNDKKMWYAVHRLVHGNDFRKYNKVSSRMYKTLKENFQKHNRHNKGNLGRHLTEEAKEKIRQSKLGEKNPMYGRVQSAEERRRRSEALKGHKAWNKGKKTPREVVEKIAAKNRGKKRSDEVKKRMSEAQRGHPVSDEARRRMSEARKRYYREKAERVNKTRGENQ